MNLFDLARAEGWTLVVDDQAPDRPDILGSPQRDELSAQACAGNVVAIQKTLAPSNAFFSVAHEIAETRYDFTGHHQHVWREQCNILARWCRKLTVELETVLAQDARELDAVRGSLDQCRRERSQALGDLVHFGVLNTNDYRSTKDVPVVWRGSVGDLVTDLEPLLGIPGLDTLERLLREKREARP